MKTLAKYKMKTLGKYKNGNYITTIYNNGTKIRENDLDNLIPDFPENIDLKITNKCEQNCKWCHEKSDINGKHADILNAKFINTLHPYTELAIGGGNVLLHPDLISFLNILKQKNIIANITINQYQFMNNLSLIKQLIDNKLIYGLGVSYVKYDELFLNEIKKYDNIVLHVINGLIELNELKQLYDKDLKILILGYKIFGRGKDYYNNKIIKNIDLMNKSILMIMSKFKIASFDNLALKQLKLKDKLPTNIWNQFYMGDDGQYTMYIDLVNNQFAKNSTSIKRYDLLNDIKDMFDIIRR